MTTICDYLRKLDVSVLPKGIKTLAHWIVGIVVFVLTIDRISIQIQNAGGLYLGMNSVPFLESLLREDFAQDLLQVVSLGLVVSGAIEFSYMLFTEELDEAIVPLIYGVAATFLIILHSEPTKVSNSKSIAVLTFVLNFRQRGGVPTGVGQPIAH